MKTLKDTDIAGKTLLIRVDYNVPLDKGKVIDDTRIRLSLPTIEYALEQGCKIILCSHAGKPKTVDSMLSLLPIARHLENLINKPVEFLPSLDDAEIKNAILGLDAGQILFLENLRFYPAETSSDETERRNFAKKLVADVDVFVNDAFGVSHRSNASVVEALEEAKVACMGFLMKSEIMYLGRMLKNAVEHPYVLISGGVKVSSKLGILESMLGVIDDCIIGGAMANTFLKAQGYDIGDSLVENDLIDIAANIIATGKAKGTNVHLPIDCVVATSFDSQEPPIVYDVADLPSKGMILDIGPKTQELFADVITRAKTIVWNGPMGLFERSEYVSGSLAVCNAVAANQDALSIVGGGDTDAVVDIGHAIDKMSFISTGGGAFLAFLEGKNLPAFDAFRKRDIL